MVDNDKNITKKNDKKIFVIFVTLLHLKKTDFTRHLATDKHKKVVNDSKMVEKDCNLTTKNENKLYECKCGKTYKYDSGKN